MMALPIHRLIASLNQATTLPADTVLYIPFLGTNGSTTIPEYTGKTINVVGDAVLNNAQYKFNGTALKLDGNGDYLSCTNTNLDLSSTDYTIATWIYIDNPSMLHSGIYTGFFSQAYGRVNLEFFTDGSIALSEQDSYGSNNSYVISSTGIISIGTWYYVEASKSGTTCRLRVDGTTVGTFTSPVRSNHYGYARIGAIDPGDPLYSLYFKGYMQDFIICKSILYPSDYSAPTGFIAV